MTAATTLPGIGAPLGSATRRCVRRDTTPRRRRASRAVYRRRRLLAAVLVVAAVVVAGEAGVALGGSPLASPERRPAPTSSTAVVRTGDSLWSIVERARPGADPRPLVDALHVARDGAPLVPGERIRLPR